LNVVRTRLKALEKGSDEALCCSILDQAPQARGMSEESEYEFFKLRRQAKTYISKVFTFGEMNPEPLRNIRMVAEGNDRVLLGEIDGVSA
jgi:hypothetical protein